VKKFYHKNIISPEICSEKVRATNKLIKRERGGKKLLTEYIENKEKSIKYVF
jgi:hypothetical protein